MPGMEQKRRQKDRLLDTTSVPQDASLQDLQVLAGGLMAKSQVGEPVFGGASTQDASAREQHSPWMPLWAHPKPSDEAVSDLLAQLSPATEFPCDHELPQPQTLILIVVCISSTMFISLENEEMRKTSNAMLCPTGSSWTRSIANASCKGHGKENVGSCSFPCNRAHLCPLKPSQGWYHKGDTTRAVYLNSSQLETDLSLRKETYHRTTGVCFHALAGRLLDGSMHSRKSAVATNVFGTAEPSTPGFLLSAPAFILALLPGCSHLV